MHWHFYNFYKAHHSAAHGVHVTALLETVGKLLYIRHAKTSKSTNYSVHAYTLMCTTWIMCALNADTRLCFALGVERVFKQQQWV